MGNGITEFGTVPDRIGVNLATGGKFRSIAEYEDETGALADWPAGATLTFVFGNGISWPATIVGSQATWDVAKADADLIPDGTSTTLAYTDAAGSDEVWGLGPVKRHG